MCSSSLVNVWVLVHLFIKLVLVTFIGDLMEGRKARTREKMECRRGRWHNQGPWQGSFGFTRYFISFRGKYNCQTCFNIDIATEVLGMLDQNLGNQTDAPFQFDEWNKGPHNWLPNLQDMRKTIGSVIFGILEITPIFVPNLGSGCPNKSPLRWIFWTERNMLRDLSFSPDTKTCKHRGMAWWIQTVTTLFVVRDWFSWFLSRCFA